MSCNNCFNGCAETVSDQCIKYTGANIASLGIATGDSLASVEAAITTYLISALDGTGIVPYIDSNSLCALVTSYLPVSGPITLNDLVDTLIKSICDLQTQVTSVTDDMTILNANYTISCLTGVTASSDTHDIVQAVITKLCSVSASVTALALDLSTNYVPITEINDYIAAYLADIGSSTLMCNRMVPYTVVEFWDDPTGKFDVSGAGLGDWLNVYLCNGQNNTPDKRGRVGIGVTNGMGGGAYNSAVDPAISGNPTYTLGNTGGANTVTLTEAQMPSHTHTAQVTEVPHTHSYVPSGQDNGNIGTFIETGNAESYSPDNTVGSALTGITVVNLPKGSGAAHSNIQPVLACYYIMYIP